MIDYTADILTLTASCVALLDGSGRIEKVTSYMDQLPGKTASDMAGRTWSHVFEPLEDNACGTEDLGQILGAGRVPDPAKGHLTRFEDGFIEWRFSAVCEKKGTSGRIMGVGRDVSALVQEKKARENLQRELELQLQHAERLATVGQLAAGIAHELNGPLNNILGYAQLAAKQPDLPEQVYTDLDNIVRFSLHTREIVKKVMLFSRQMPPKQETVNLNKVIGESLYFSEPLCTKTGVKISCDLSRDLPDMTADSSQLHQIMVNLIVNAAQAMTVPGGSISISTRVGPGREVILRVRDTGEGMDQDTLMKCFMPFFTTKDVDKGTGLGLSVVHGIVEAHGGTITADSIPGRGSCFKIVFPINTAQGEGHV